MENTIYEVVKENILLEEVFVLCFLREMIEIIIDFLRAFSKKLYLTKKLYFFVYSIQKGKSYFVKNKKVENKFFKNFSKKLYLTKKLYFFV